MGLRFYVEAVVFAMLWINYCKAIKVIIAGPWHGSTTSFSRLLCDVDPNCMYFFEPDHGAHSCHADSTGLRALLNCSIIISKVHLGTTRDFLPPCGFTWRDPTDNANILFHASFSSHSCKSINDCKTLENQCRRTRHVMLKTISITSAHFWQDLLGAGTSFRVVQLVKDPRSLVNSRFKEAMKSWNAAQMQTKGRELVEAEMKKYCDQMLEGVEEICNASRTATRVIRINAHFVEGKSFWTQVNVVDKARSLLGLAGITKINTRVPLKRIAELPDFKNAVTSHSHGSRWHDSEQHVHDFQQIAKKYCSNKVLWADYVFDVQRVSPESDWRCKRNSGHL